MIPYKFSDADNFSEGLAAVCDNQLWGYINLEGEYQISLKYKDCNPFSENIASVLTNKGWIYIDRLDRQVINETYEFAGSFKDGIAHVKKNGEYYFINKLGERVEKKTEIDDKKINLNIKNTLFIQDIKDIPEDIKKIKILEYLSIYTLLDKYYIINDSNYKTYLKKIFEADNYLFRENIEIISLEKNPNNKNEITQIQSTIKIFAFEYFMILYC